jgi:ERF superfamily
VSEMPQTLVDKVDAERKRDKERTPVTINEAEQALNGALAKAQGKFPPIPKTQAVDTGSYSYSYAPLDVILGAVRPVLSDHGLALVQRLEAPGGTPSLRTEIRHAGGGCIAASFPLPIVPQNMQQLGSVVSFLRRYAAVAILGIAAEEDDAGAQAQAAAPKAEHEPASPDRTGSSFEPPPEPPIPKEPGYESGYAPKPKQAFEPPPLRADVMGADRLSDPQRKKIYALRTKLLNAGAFSEEEWQLVLSAEFGTESVSELTKQQASNLIERLVRKEEELGLGSAS